MRQFDLHNNKWLNCFNPQELNIVEHIQHIYEEGELDEHSIVGNSEQFKPRETDK